MKKWLVAPLIIFILILAPNLMWLNWSTLFIKNTSSKQVNNITVEICSETFQVASKPHSSSLRLLPKCGDATLILKANAKLVCQYYVEGELYNVEADVGSGKCKTDLPIISSLFLLKLIK
ncbi:MAG TPA: hypothetical protein VLB82_13150 [Thermodesulfobacteriota bacterium]|nr:hypothetical protein [Thermodesulfobacteriota bacterium]